MLSTTLSQAPVIALDLGGTKLDAALVIAGELVPGSRVRNPTGRSLDGPTLEQLLRTAVAHAAAASEDPGSIAGIGIGAPGPVAGGGDVLEPVNMPLVSGFNLRDALTSIAADVLGRDVPIVLGHDGGCFALGEATYGAAAGTKASMSVVVSTGVGGGIVVNGAVLRGASGNAGHIGQTRDASGLTVEEVAAGPHAVRWAQTEGFDGADGEALSVAARDGNPTALAAIERSAKAVGAALANSTTLLDLEVIVIGGGFSRVSEDYIDQVQRALEDAAFLGYAKRTRVVRSTLGDTGPLVGAAAQVLV